MFREAQYESTYQIAIVFFSVFWIRERELDWEGYCSLVTSFFTIGKAGTDNLFTFGNEDKMTNASLLDKLKMVAKYSPIFMLTTFFRIGCLASTTIAAGVGSDDLGFVNSFRPGVTLAVPLVFAVPLCVLLLCNSFLPLVTMGEVIQGAIGEAFTITVWGNSGREGSKRLQLGEKSLICRLY